MGMNVGGSSALNSDINVTPLVDVVLVLLIIFMVVTPLTQRGYDIDIPREAPPTSVPPPTDTKQVILAISEQDCRIVDPLGRAGLPPNCQVRLNKDAIKLTELPTKMGEIFRNRKKEDKILFLAAQEKLNYEAVVQIVDIAKSGVGDDLRIGIVTDEKLATATPAAGM
jgi:biopolymer transport protein TolR